jgi:hypothetical protein
MTFQIENGPDITSKGQAEVTIQEGSDSLDIQSNGSINTNVVFQDSANLDAFSRVRVSQPISIFNSHNSYGLDSDIWETISNGAGSSSTYFPNENSTSMAVGTVSGEYIIRQTYRYFPYTPGKSQLIVMTGVLGVGNSNVTKRIGYFDNSNGLFFELEGTTLKVVKRSFVTGSAVDSFVSQVDWNIDKFDGTGPSGAILDVTKAQIFIIDFQWLGVGRVRFGFDIDGVIYYCHQMLHANSTTAVYMTTATLPLRYEIVNTGVSIGSSLKVICSSVTSEGGIIPEGEVFSVSSGIVSRSITTRSPIFAERMKETLNSKVNRRTARLLSLLFKTITNDAYIEVIHGHTASAITATWISSGIDSGVEYSTDISAITLAEAHKMTSTFGISSTGQTSTITSEDTGIVNEHNYIYLDYAGTGSTYWVVYATAFTGTSSISTIMDIIEY